MQRSYPPDVKAQRAETRKLDAEIRRIQRERHAAPELRALPGELRICQWDGCSGDWHKECPCCGPILCDDQRHWVPSPSGEFLHCGEPECRKRGDELIGTCWFTPQGEWKSDVSYYHLSELIFCGQPGYRATGRMAGNVDPVRRREGKIKRKTRATLVEYC